MRNTATLNVIDIGSAGGLEYPWSKYKALVGTTLSFEPNGESFSRGNLLQRNIAIWDRDGEADFFLYGEDGMGSSLLMPNLVWVKDNYDWLKTQGDPRLAATFLERAQLRGSVKRQIRKLDTVLTELPPDRPRFHFLKSDTQSGEGFVLDGAGRYLAQECLGIELECFRYPLYEGIQLEGEVFRHLGELGFQRWGWTGYQASFASQADYLFLKTPNTEEEGMLISTIQRVYGTDGPNFIIKNKTPFERLLGRLKSNLTPHSQVLSRRI
jgi:FkbM family methyltransferase